MSRLRAIVGSSLLVCACGCTASSQDCAELGDKFVELFASAQTEDSQKLGPEILEAAAEVGRAEVVSKCEKKSTRKGSVRRCLKATSMEEFLRC
jgi:hypothetical protein